MQSAREHLLLLFSTPLYAIVIALEVLLSHFRKQKTYSIKDTIQNVYLMLLNGGIDLLFRSVYLGIVLLFFYSHRIANPIQNPWIYWILLLVFEDLMYYWLHRIDHVCRFFWATHFTHHSSNKFNLTVGFRSSVFEPLYRFLYFIPISWLGFEPLDIAFMYSCTQIWGILIHTEKVNKLGILEYILVTPSHHRVHHGSNPKYLDKNMGMFLIIWDKLFGTFQPELPPCQYEPIKYGLTKPMVKENAVNIITHEWSNIYRDIQQENLSTWQKMKYIFGAPGWSHDGSRLTSAQIRRLEIDKMKNEMDEQYP